MKNDREFTGTLLGFDDFVSTSSLPPSPIICGSFNLFLFLLCVRYGPGGRDGIVRPLSSSCPLSVRKRDSYRRTTLCFFVHPRPRFRLAFPVICSETTPQGKKTTELNQTLLNGNNICMVSSFLFILTTNLVIDLLPQLIPGSSGPDQ